MRTNIDMPDALMERVKTVAARRNTTFRALVVDALERSLEATKQPFELQDASVGYSRESGGHLQRNHQPSDRRTMQFAG